MTTPCYPQGCAAGSKVPGLASDPSSNAWNVNFNNGNSNWNNQNNDGLVLACRSASECQGDVTIEQLHKAWQEARRQKSSHNQMMWEADWMGGLIKLQDQLRSGRWLPSASNCFISTKPKAREIHAPDFADRVMHHWLVPQLEAVYEPSFIFDSYANRTGKGTHQAAERLKQHMRQVSSGQGGGYYLQLDIHNFFNSIHRPTLWKLLKKKMAGKVPKIAQQAAHALLRRHPLAQGVTYCAKDSEREQVPPHKRLENAALGCGLPIGNLSSQFFANVYLNELDQFIKHELKVKRYVRYVDDFVLVHKDRAQLQEWQAKIEVFLHDRLRLKLKPDIKLNRLNDGCDFLGYVLYPTHTRVRRRVIQHYREKLWMWERQHVRAGQLIATPEQFRKIKSVSSSYEGHFAHADARGLRDDFNHRYPWLSTIQAKRRFSHKLEGQQISINYPRRST